MEKVMTEVSVPGLAFISGKVRERALVDPTLGLYLFVTTDRISAFDVVLPTGIPGKGRILNQLSVFWFNFLREVVPNHLVSSDDETCLSYLGQISPQERENLKGRMILAKKAEVIPVECVVRGYISGSLWKEYLKMAGKEPVSHKISVLGHQLPGNLQESAELPIPIFTPATKALEGHDQNLSYEEMVDHLTRWLSQHPEISLLTTADLLAQSLRSTSLTLYLLAREYAKKRGIIIADTKFEFGFIDGKLHLIDEVLTPDSSRFWPVESYQPGQPQESLDKQYVRDWLDNVAKWNHEEPAPELAEEIIARTAQKYQKIYQLLV